MRRVKQIKYQVCAVNYIAFSICYNCLVGLDKDPENTSKVTYNKYLLNKEKKYGRKNNFKI